MFGSVNMTDQSLGRGKFAGLLLLLQGLLLILFVVFAGYSEDLLPGFEDGNKTDSTYFGITCSGSVILSLILLFCNF